MGHGGIFRYDTFFDVTIELTLTVLSGLYHLHGSNATQMIHGHLYVILCFRQKTVFDLSYLICVVSVFDRRLPD